MPVPADEMSDYKKKKSGRNFRGKKYTPQERHEKVAPLVLMTWWQGPPREQYMAQKGDEMYAAIHIKQNCHVFTVFEWCHNRYQLGKVFVYISFFSNMNIGKQIIFDVLCHTVSKKDTGSNLGNTERGDSVQPPELLTSYSFFTTSRWFHSPGLNTYLHLCILLIRGLFLCRDSLQILLRCPTSLDYLFISLQRLP